jgi:hypothetical protein
MKFLEFFKHLIFVFEKVDPCKFFEVINETHIIFIFSNGDISRTPYLREIEF